MQEEFYNREKLYEEVWSDTMIEIAKRYGVSNVALAKTCKKLNIPRPPVGYWVQKEFGKEPPRPDLPEYSNYPKIKLHHLQTDKKSDKQSTMPSRSVLVPAVFTEADKLIEKESKPGFQIKVHKQYKNLHPYVFETNKLFKSKKKPYWGYEYGRKSIRGNDVFSIDVDPESIDRVTAILQALCLAAEKRGFQIIENNEKYSPSACFLIMGHKVSFKIVEETKRKTLPDEVMAKLMKNEKFETTGRLTLKIDNPYHKMNSQKSWSDGKKQKLERILNKVMIGLIYAAAWEAEKKEAYIQYEKECEIEAQKQKERDRLKRINDERIAALESNFLKWIKYKQLKDYISEVKDNYQSDSGGSDFQLWMEWANDYVESINPFIAKAPVYEVKDPYPWL